ncbi:hypothetical protein C495_11179 [Natronorubrum sulfidifaciens JCM 14089]|uniref:Uncharacterized protein n=1 Tax=Natronorubrum sulfidifaciens JCM 14089 TaxID=1230460 RepID=L9W591_9EURY|nr:hypothetical protein C495_11179 [Natronorubrum sulfidifaciens JCM 14089]
MILIGAIALAFIILGVVVVFNGVVYTETLSSSETGQSATTAEATELEVTQGVACVLDREDMASGGVSIENIDGNELTDDDPEAANDHWDDTAGAEIETFSDQYRNATAHSRPAVVAIDDDPDFILDGDNVILDGDLTVTITYDTNDLRYERTVDVNPEACPS